MEKKKEKNDTKNGKKKITKKSLKSYSQESIEFLTPIYAYLRVNGFDDKNIYWKDNEYSIFDEFKIRRYDFTVPKLNLIIEYNGSMWHYNPNFEYPEDFKSPFNNLTLEELKENDEHKRKLAIENGFTIFEVFDTDDKEEKQKEIIDWIKNRIRS